MPDIEITNNTEASRYELRIDGELASVAEYTPSGGRLVFDHTETLTGFRGRGLAAKLVSFALDDVKKRNVGVVPSCWFVADFIEEHPEFSELVS